VRAFQSEFPKCDVLLNNNCEVFNKYILEARELPVLAMILKIKCQITTRVYNKQVEAQSMTGTICPKIRKKLQKHIEWSNICEAKPSGNGIFEIMELHLLLTFRKRAAVAGGGIYLAFLVGMPYQLSDMIKSHLKVM
jgi:hypothetical protein